MPQLEPSALANSPDLVNTCLNLLLKGATSDQVHELQVLATRLSVAIPAVAEQLLAELTKDRLADKDRDKEAVVETKVQELTVETIDTFREELADRAAYVNKLSQDELNVVVGSLVEVQRREEMSNTAASPTRSQFVEDQWQSLQASLEADVARQRDALSLVAMDSSAPVAVDLLKEQRALAQTLDADRPGTVSGLIVELKEVDSQLEGLRAEQQKASTWERYHSIKQLEQQHSQLTLDSELAMSLLDQTVSQKLEECRTALRAEQARVPEGSAVAKRYEAALERLEPDFEAGPAERTRRVSPWGNEVERSVSQAEYLKSVDFHAEMRQETVWKVFELVADLKKDGVISQNDPVGVVAAAYQLDKGALEERTNAAHKLPGQLTIGVEQAKLADAALAERFRLDNLVPAAEDLLKQSVRGWFGTTTVTDLHVNAVDSLWEKKGLAEAFRSAVEDIVRQPNDADRQAVIDQAYARFRDDALAYLELARDHNESKLREMDRLKVSQDAIQDQDSRTLTRQDRESMRQVMDEYQRRLEERRQEEIREAVAWRRA